VTFRALLIGDALLDVTLGTATAATKMRLGGVFHAARTAWALKASYELALIAPDYLHLQATDYAEKHGASETKVIGTVVGAPNVIIISEAKEVGSQGYELLLRDEYKCVLDKVALKSQLAKHFTDILIFPGQYDLSAILEACSGTKSRVHIDIANGIKRLSELEAFSRAFDTIITSTSSDLFSKSFGGSPARMAEEVAKKSRRFLFKENRGGARLFEGSKVSEVGAQLRPIVHSVGVGDCFDMAYVYTASIHELTAALAYASFVAADYAGTTYVDDFNRSVTGTLSNLPAMIVQLSGVRIPWERRPDLHIYIAAPDFDFTDRAPIESIYESLRYHNFSPHRPVQENGQMGKNASVTRRQNLFNEDMKLLERCQLVVAVLPYDDPGTLIEIGLAAAKGKPVLVFVPRGMPENLVLTQLPHLITQRQDELIDDVFRLAAEVLAT
jgi:nucleoside 2-deoxyribosyltransferase